MTRKPSNPRPAGSPPKLTSKQHRLIGEIEDIVASVQMDYLNILDCEEGGRNSILELMKQQPIRG
jgi:hypothetical protein